MIAQLFHLSSAERKTLLVAGAAAGMSATFASPVAAVLLAVELLLFEWKPRSMIPVALASATAAVLRRYLIGLGPLFPTPPHPAFIGPQAILSCLVVGLLAGALSALLTVAVYASEDAFRKLPIHWMWWPAIGGLAIGLGGLIFPQALGVGYDTISALLHGNVPLTILLGVLLIKSAIWAISLGSGTSGGVLAPLLLMGGALGGLLTPLLPVEGPGFWPLVSMGAMLGGTMRSPFTGIVFMLELTHDVNALLPLLIAVTTAHAFTVLVMRRSILTEKVSRRGYHLTREYSIDPLEIIFIREVMRTSIVALPASLPQKELLQSLRHTSSQHGQHLYPLIDEQERLVGVLTRRDLLELLAGEGQAEQQDGRLLSQAIRRQPVICYPDEPLRPVVYRMAATGLTRLPVIERESGRLVGLVSISDLLQARVRTLIEEQRRERVLRIRLLFPFGTRLRALRLREEHLAPSGREGSEGEQTPR